MNETTTTDTRLPQVQDILFDMLGCMGASTNILPEHDLVEDLGADSLDVVEILMAFEEHYDLDIPDEDVEGKIAKVQDILDYLNKRLGPAEPINGILELTDEQFIDRYRPEKDPENDSYYRQRDWDVAADVEAIEAAKGANRVWTAMDDDNGRFCIVNGIHRINRIYYILTSRAPEDENWNIQIYDPEDAPVYILCTVKWDLDDAEGPPTEVVVNLRDALGLGENEVTEENSSEIADYLSDTHGFCVQSFDYKSITEEEAAAHGQ